MLELAASFAFVGCQNEPALETEYVKGWWIVSADRRVGIFDGLYQLSAILTANFHVAILPLRLDH